MAITVRSTKSNVVKKELSDWLIGAKPGYRLMSERELALHFKVSRPTIRKAVDDLVDEGMLRRVQGSGVYVKDNSIGQGLKICLAYSRDADDQHFAPFAEAMLHEFELVISQGGDTFSVTSIDKEINPSNALKQADGVIALCPLTSSLLSINKPLVSFGNASRHYHPGIPYVMADNHQSAYDVADYHIALGHRRLSFVGNTLQYAQNERYRGVCTATSEANLPEPILMDIIFGESVASDIRALLESGVTAVICSNDNRAMALISALHRVGLRVPEDISVTGFDDLPISAMFHPPLTTVKIHAYNAASIAVDELKWKISGKGNGIAKRIVLPGELVIRNSCAPPNITAIKNFLKNNPHV